MRDSRNEDITGWEARTAFKRRLTIVRTLILLSILATLGACGGSRYKKSSGPQPSDPSTSDAGDSDTGGIDSTVDPGADDNGSDPQVDDPGSGDDGYDDPTDDPGSSDDGGGDASSDVAEVKGSPVLAGLSSRITLEAINFDAVPYVLYVRADFAGRKRRKLFLPALPAAPSGSFAESSEPIRLRPGVSYSLVLKAPDGRTLDVEPIDATGGVSKKSFSVVGSNLLASQG